jgi:hypothetical protein
MGMSRREHLPPLARVTAAWRRAGYLFLLAFLFRFQTWAVAWPHSPWTDLFRVDVLNLMGATAAVLAVLALCEGLSRMRAALLAGVVIAAGSPLVAGMDTSSWPPILRHYIVPSTDSFGIFPWGAYLTFGLAAGSAIPLIQRLHLLDQGTWSRVMEWSAVCGFALLLGGQYFSNLPYSLYSKSDFWINSPALVACKMGVTLLLGSGVFLWTEYIAAEGWSWVRQLGTTSLLVYWAHVELIYGRWLWTWKEHLTLWQTLAAVAGVTALMVALSLVVKRTPWRELWNRTWSLRISPPVPAEATKASSLATSRR